MIRVVPEHQLRGIATMRRVFVPRSGCGWTFTDHGDGAATGAGRDVQAALISSSHPHMQRVGRGPAFGLFTAQRQTTALNPGIESLQDSAWPGVATASPDFARIRMFDLAKRMFPT